MTHARRNTLLGIVLAAAFLAVVFSAASEALDRPVIDTRKSETCRFIDREILDNLPTSGRTFAPIAQTVPGQVTLENRFNSSRNLTGFIIDGARADTAPAQPFVLDFSKVQINKRDCSYKGEKKGVDLGGGYTATVQYTRHTEPEDRAYLRAYNLRLNGGPIRGEQLWFFKPMGTQVADQPPPENIPVVPGPPVAPVPPVDPAPATGFPIYLGGPNLLNGARANGKVWAVQHTNCDDHTVIQGGVSYRMCLAGEGDTSLTAFNVTPKKFDFKKDPIPQGWEWTPFACGPGPDGTVGCTAKGKYRGYDILSTITNLQVTPGTLNFGANINVRLLSTGGDVGFRAAGQVESLGP